ncbi:putative UBC5-E2 ubiquitin-conjugating enzyme [Tilletiaria anomala UBC 951]|uniref:E2 ubiquitin-conjugating enzyme n=1 Tax=Tilletiaria anomala (strain ATCC 24038 / CBS 436.72 / UBC 951) TaxID=1037660 RepID=A0A066VEK4_TILAU|nr:putative UBC5-E2 ubiquitin-conjugating enzyme [Tilletiaria anomala UBC 951]KDN37020.1 putative UBC5-E2 ubiquitin-conjugating enzyme [Tilletiaria anomala UBC 951]
MVNPKRITKELADLQNEPVDNVVIEPNEDNIYRWTAIVSGPSGTPYEGGKFNLQLDFPIEYPFKAPKVKFNTKIYHPNVDDNGNMCVGIVKSEAWKPSTKAQTIILSILQLLQEPNPDDALVASIAEEYNKNRILFDKNAAEWTQKYAK